jgi:hypothetical protein
MIAAVKSQFRALQSILSFTSPNVLIAGLVGHMAPVGQGAAPEASEGRKDTTTPSVKDVAMMIPETVAALFAILFMSFIYKFFSHSIAI